MGLGAKIKEALHSDHHDKTTTDARPPGAFPQDDVSQKHTDGKEYIAPHGSLIDKNRNTGTAGTTGAGLGSVPSGGADSLSHSNTHRNKLHKEEGYLPSETYNTTSGTRGHKTVDSGVGLGQTSGRDHTSSEGAYWGDLSPSGHVGKGHSLNKDLPDRSHGDYSPTGAGHNVSSLPDRTTHDHSLSHDRTTGSAGHNNPLYGDQAVGGGVYNSVTGAGSPGHDRSHGSAKPHVSGGAVHDPLTSGTRGASAPSGTNEYDYKTSLGGAGAPTSRGDRTTGPGLVGAGDGASGYGAGNTHNQHSDVRGSERGLGQGGLTGSGLGGSGLGGNGLSGSGVGRPQGHGDNGLTHHDQSTGHGNTHAGAGLAGAGAAAAAGYGASEFAHRGQGSIGHSGSYESPSSHHAPGVPRTSMLDVEQPSGGITGSHHGQQATGVPHNASLGSERNVTPPQHGVHGIGGGSPTNVGSGVGTHIGQSSPTSSGHGNTHYGPGHPGAKVMHQCQHCGRDNDISNYFKSDVVYRLGQ